MSWTEERIAALKKLWEGGATASQIAEELGAVSRNAVIGKAHRLGLKARPSPVKPNDKKAGGPMDKDQAAVKPASIAAVLDAAAETPPKAFPTPRIAAPAPTKATPAEDERPAWSEDEDGDDKGVSGVEAVPTLRDADEGDDLEDGTPAPAVPSPRIVSVGPGGFLRQGPGDQQPPIPPAPPRRLVPAKPSPEIANKTSLLDLNDKICRWPMGHPGEPDFHFCGQTVNPGFPYCVDHCGRAYQAQLPRGARRPPPPLPFGGPRVR